MEFVYYTYKIVSDLNPVLWQSLPQHHSSEGVGDGEYPGAASTKRARSCFPSTLCSSLGLRTLDQHVWSPGGTCSTGLLTAPPGHRTCPAVGHSSGLSSPALLRGAARFRAANKLSPLRWLWQLVGHQGRFY